MVFLLDTNIASAVMAGEAHVLDRLTKLPAADSVVISSVTRGELRHGIERLPLGKRRASLEHEAEKLFQRAPCLPVDEAAGDAYGRIKALLESAGRPIGKDNDLWIAAVALAYGCVLVSAQRSFSHVPGLPVEDWTAD